MTTDMALLPPPVTPDQLDLIRHTIAKDATPDELKLYLYDCARQGVHPLDRLIHFTKRSGKYAPITSIDFMRIRAADTGEMAGSDDPVFFTLEEHPVSATVTVYRLTHGQRFAYTATARWAEYKPEQNDFMWRKMPHTMLGKCAEALALRKGFPRQLAGLYAQEEMDQATVRAPDPPAALVDVRTGEAVSPATKPDPPLGFGYLDACVKDGAWWTVTWLGESYKTKLERIGVVAEQAYQDGVPVRCESKKKPWLDTVTPWKPGDDAPPLTAGEIPF